MYRTQWEARWISMVLVLVLFPLFLSTADLNAQDFFGTEVSPGAALLSNEEKDSFRHRYMTLSGETLGETVVFDLFDDLRVVAAKSSTSNFANSSIWIGNLVGDPSSMVLLSRHQDGTWFGKITTLGKQYQIRYKNTEIYAVVEVDTSNMDEELDEALMIESIDGSGGSKSLSPNQSQFLPHPSVCEENSTCASQTMTIMVLYTEAAMLGLGGTQSAAETAIAAAVAELDLATTNSQVNHSFELVHMDLINYVESGNIRTDRDRLQDPNDGYMDTIHEGRALFGADIVSVIVGSGGCGIAFIQEDPTEMDPQKGFNITEQSCMTGNLTFSHEVGHNIGLRHDRFVDFNDTPCEPHHGYVNQEALLPNSPASARWRTLMAYGNQCRAIGIACGRLPFWSNPEVTFNGDPMGTPLNQADPTFSAYGLNRTSCVVSQFSTPSADDMIWVVSDYSLEPWMTGETRDFVWRSNFNDLVDLELMLDGQSVFIIEEDYPNDEYYSLSLPNNLAASCDYQIQVKKSTDSNLVGLSEEFCWGDYVELIAPNDTTLFNYDLLSIKGQKSFDENVNIKLYQNDLELQTIVSDWSFDIMGTYEWVSSIVKLEPGCLYKIRIEKVGTPSAYDESDEYLCFEQRDLVVTNPLADAIWGTWSQETFTWESVFASNVDVYLREINGNWTYILAEDIPNTGQLLLDLPDWIKDACDYKVVVRVRDTGEEAESRGNICIENPNAFSIRAKGLLGGALLESGLMRTDLNDQGFMPIQQPYNDVHGFRTSQVALGEEVVDWVWIELRTGIGPETAVAKRVFFMGPTNGITSPFQLATFYGVPNGDYYAVLGHRNHLPVMTASPISMAYGTLPLVDFRQNLYSANGGPPAMTLADGKLALWPGDVLPDGQVVYSGASNDRVEVLGQAGGPTPFDFVIGYLTGDTNLDGKVTYSGALNDRVIILDSSGGPTPFNSISTQVPGY